MAIADDEGTVEVSSPAEGVCLVRIRRERKLNALSAAVERRLAEALDGETVRACRCLMIAGGERAFSAGADLTELRDLSPEAVIRYYEQTGAVYEQLAELPQPTVAAISGYCLGGGLELALAVDLRVADATTVFGLPEVSIGILPSSGGTLRLARMLGPARTKELVLLGDRFDGARARDLGLVTELVEPGAAEARGLELASRLAALPPLAVAVTKRAIDAMAESSTR
ncbi:MAG TPA: enoyl-CoA hydratase/isomerase family protein, partial [Gaiellales bacterium]|nr:enoyl-CoA hydratase/isomerase family protein [Gaiellales bacterium]